MGGRRLAFLGRTVQLIPPQHVKPSVRRGKNDRNDAEAVSKAARPGRPSVPVRSAGPQAGAIVPPARELLVRQRTQLVRAVRGQAAEFGVIVAKGSSQLPALLEAGAAGEAVPATAKRMLAFLGWQVAQLDGPAETRGVCGWDRGVGTPDEAAAQGQPGQPTLGRGARHRPDRRSEPGAHH